jgi:hypothetical protein
MLVGKSKLGEVRQHWAKSQAWSSVVSCLLDRIPSRYSLAVVTKNARAPGAIRYDVSLSRRTASKPLSRLHVHPARYW